MATTTSFKQTCPKCDAPVAIKDANLVGRKIDCPKCKFRFTVEKPPVTAEASAETKPAKITKTTDSPAATTKVVNGKPANGQPANGKPTNGKPAESKGVNGKPAPVKGTNGKPAAEKTASDKVTDKPAPAAKNGKPAVKKAKSADADGAKKKKAKKKTGGISRTLILGGILGVLAVIALVVAAVAFWPSKDKSSQASNGKPGTPPSNNPGNPNPGGSNGTGDDKKDEKKDDTPQAPPSIADISNLLPNNTEVVVAVNAPAFLATSFHRAAFLTPGAFQENQFQSTLGFPVGDLQRTILGYIPAQNGVFSVLRTAKPIARDKLKAGLKLDEQPPVKGLNKHLVKAHLDSLSNFLIKGNQPQEACYLHIADDYTLVFANQPVMDQFLSDNARPKFLTEKDSSPPPEQPKKEDMGQKNPPMPPMPPMPMPPMPMQPKPMLPPMTNPAQPGGMKTGSLVNPPDEQGPMEVFVKEPNGQFVAYQQGRGDQPQQGGGRAGQGGGGAVGPAGPGQGGNGPAQGGGAQAGGAGPGQGNPGPVGPGGPGNPGPGGPGTGGTKPPPPPPAPGPSSDAFMTVVPELKSVLDKVQDPKNPPFLVVAAYGRTGFAAQVGQRLLDAIPRAGERKDSPFGGFGLDSEQVLKSKADPFHDVQYLAFALSALENKRIQASLALDGRDEQSRTALEKTVRYFGSIMPYYFRGALDSLDIKGIPLEETTTPTDPNQYPMPGQPMPGVPNTLPGTPGSDPDIGKGRDGSLTLTKYGDALVLGLEMKLESKPGAYSTIMRKLDEFCVQLKSQAELADTRSHVHELAAALQAYLKDNRNNASFPPGAAPRQSTGDRKVGYPPQERLSWMAAILPYLGSGAYRDLHPNPNASWSEGENLTVAQVIVLEFLARSRTDQPATIHYPKITPPLAVTHFVGMAGVGYDAADYRADDPAVAAKIGVFGYDRVTKVSDIKGGLDKTIVMIQVKAEDAAPWLAGGGSTVRGVSDDPSDPSAVKPFVCMQYDGHDGTVAIMGDGKVRFIPATIHNKDFRGLCAINGEKPADLEMIAPEIPPPEDAATIKPAPPPAPPKEDPKPVQVDPASGAGAGEWKEVTSKEGRFTVQMLGKVANPKEEKNKDAFGGAPLMVQVSTVEATKELFVAAYLDVPDAEVAKGADAVYKTMLDSMNKQGGGAKAVGEKKVTAGGISGVEYRLEKSAEAAPGGKQAVMRMFLSKNRLYLLLAGTDGTALNEQNTVKFLESFKVTDPAAPK